MSPLIWIQLMVLPLLLVGQWLSDWAEFASAHARGRPSGWTERVWAWIRDLRSPTYDRGILGNDPRVPGTRGSGPDTAQGNHPNRRAGTQVGTARCPQSDRRAGRQRRDTDFARDRRGDEAPTASVARDHDARDLRSCRPAARRSCGSAQGGYWIVGRG